MFCLVLFCFGLLLDCFVLFCFVVFDSFVLNSMTYSTVQKQDSGSLAHAGRQAAADWSDIQDKRTVYMQHTCNSEAFTGVVLVL